jgi:hypothetical protein
MSTSAQTELELFMGSVVVDLSGAHPAVTTPILMKWSTYEIGSVSIVGRWNPLNTTTPEPGSWNFNSAGVQSYPTQASGVAATVRTLQNGHYPQVVAAIRAGVPINDWNTPGIRAEIDTWGTHGFASYLATVGAPTPTPAPTPPPPAPTPGPPAPTPTPPTPPKPVTYESSPASILLPLVMLGVGGTMVGWYEYHHNEHFRAEIDRLHTSWDHFTHHTGPSTHPAITPGPAAETFPRRHGVR